MAASEGRTVLRTFCSECALSPRAPRASVELVGGSSSTGCSSVGGGAGKAGQSDPAAESVAADVEMAD